MTFCLSLKEFFINVDHTRMCCAPKFGAVWLSMESNAIASFDWRAEGSERIRHKKEEDLDSELEPCTLDFQETTFSNGPH